MQLEWQEPLKADPVPWLLEPENPSARYLTLRYLIGCDARDSQAVEARQAIADWPPVRDILDLMDPVNFWGRAERPFYGGAVGTHATLHLLAEMGLSSIPQVKPACENLLQHGQHPSGGFSSDGTPDRPLLCYTGNAARTLIHFGYASDPRLRRALSHLVDRAARPDGLACPYANRKHCQWGIVKALAAFAALPPADRTSDHARAVASLADAVLDHEFDFEGRDANWLDFGFPLDYQSDLVELCDVLARLGFGADRRLRPLFDLVLDEQTPQGRWVKRYGTRALHIESLGQPSKWITFRALRALKHRYKQRDRAGSA